MPDKGETKSAAKLIANAMRDALQTLASEAKDAKHALAVDAEIATNRLATKNPDDSSDHDTLIEIKTVQQTMLTEIREMKDGTNTQIGNHEVRINRLETSKSNQTILISVGIGLLSLLTSLIIYHITR